MTLYHFSTNDFQAMQTDGLDMRMEHIRETVQPKFLSFAEQLTPFLAKETGQPFYAHLAKHARRTVNPPESTWIAFSCDRRSYKKYPHFQLGIWETHVFFWLAIIDDYPAKPAFADFLLSHEQEIMQQIPTDFMWSPDHTQPKTFKQGTLTPNEWHHLFQRLHDIKKAELLCGLTLTPDAIQAITSEQLLKKMQQAAHQLMPFYRTALTTMHENNLV